MTGKNTNSVMTTDMITDAERTQALLDRMDEQNYGIAFATNKACQTCAFAHGEVDWDGRVLELDPGKCFCLIYEPDDSNGKPHDVAFDGAKCLFYATE